METQTKQTLSKCFYFNILALLEQIAKLSQKALSVTIHEALFFKACLSGDKFQRPGRKSLQDDVFELPGANFRALAENRVRRTFLSSLGPAGSAEIQDLSPRNKF